ncbi:MAG: hypothetical protein WDO73_18790 [Ignavibacteriota bacterium]
MSYEIFVPQNSDLNLKGNNGGMTVSDVRGQIHFDVNNGGVHLKRVAGDVTGATVNGRHPGGTGRRHMGRSST